MELDGADEELLLEKPSAAAAHHGGVGNGDGDGFATGLRRADAKDRAFALAFGANVAMIAAVAVRLARSMDPSFHRDTRACITCYADLCACAWVWYAQ